MDWREAWKQYTSDPGYKTLTPEEKETDKLIFFSEVVSPNLSNDVEVETAFKEFQEGTKETTWRDKVTAILKDRGPNVVDVMHGTEPDMEEKPEEVKARVSTADDLFRTLGVLEGLADSPRAFVAGALETPKLNPEEWNKLNPLQQSLVATGGALHSAYRTITEKGSHGTESSDTLKAWTGKRPSEYLPESVRPYLGLTADALFEVISDPITYTPFGLIPLIKAGKHIPKNWFGRMPEEQAAKLKAQFDKLDEMDAAERKQIADALERSRQKASDIQDARFRAKETAQNRAPRNIGAITREEIITEPSEPLDVLIARLDRLNKTPDQKAPVQKAVEPIAEQEPAPMPLITQKTELLQAEKPKTVKGLLNEIQAKVAEPPQQTAQAVVATPVEKTVAGNDFEALISTLPPNTKIKIPAKVDGYNDIIHIDVSPKEAVNYLTDVDINKRMMSDLMKCLGA